MTQSKDSASSGELTVSVGGTTIVATDAVLAQADVLRYAERQANEWQNRVEQICRLGAEPMGLQDTASLLRAAGDELGLLERRSGDLATNLVVAAEHYGATEHFLMQLAVLGSAKTGYDIGVYRNLLVLLSIAPATQVLQAWRVATQNGRDSSGSSSEIDYRFLTNPSIVVLAKLIVSSLDDVVAGSLGVPLPVDLLLGDTGLGITGVASVALAVLVVARSGGLLREGPVRVRAVAHPAPSIPPHGVGDLAARIPTAVRGRPQVRIERYGSAEHPTWAVYIGGTIDWETVAQGEPWDLTANVTAMAGQNAASLRAVMEAMKVAGINPNDPVVISGHSQGGLVGTQVAASGVFNVNAVATFGAPESPVPVPPGMATLTVEHTDDVVTAMGGDSLVDSDDRVTVRREAFASEPLPAGEALPAHNLATYRETALLIDASPEDHLQGFRDTVTGILGSETGEAVLWRGIRVPEGPAPQ